MNNDLKVILKKFWFVILVGCIFIGMAIYFAWDTNKDKLSAKSSDGKDVIFSLNDKNYTADEYYKTLFDTAGTTATNGVQMSYTLLEKSVVNQAIKETDSLVDKATSNFEDTESYYKNLYGDDYETTIGNQLKQLGYEGIDDFKQYFIDQAKKDKLVKDYIKKHTELFDEVYEKDSPRVIEHILVKCSDPENPTDTEKAKMEAVEQALAKGSSFEKVAKKYSDDTATATNKGSLGVQLKDGSLDASFQEAAWKLKSGETSEWVKSSYGYHLIKIVTTDKKEMLENSDYFDSVVTALNSYYENLSKQIVWNKAKKLGVKISDKTLKKDLLEYIGVEK